MTTVNNTTTTWCLHSKLLDVFGASFHDDIDEVICQDKWNSLSLHSKLTLEVAQKMAEVNVDKLKKQAEVFQTCRI